jgi:hypothetical protein
MFTRLLPSDPVHFWSPISYPVYEYLIARIGYGHRLPAWAGRGTWHFCSRDQASRPERQPRLQYHSGRPDLIINHYLLTGVDAVSVAAAALEWPSVSVKG